MGCMPTSLLACLIYPQKSVQHLSHKSVVVPATCVAHAPECRGTSGTRCGVSTRQRSDGQRVIVDMQRDRRDAVAIAIVAQGTSFDAAFDVTSFGADSVGAPLPTANLPLEHRHQGMASMFLVLKTLEDL